MKILKRNSKKKSILCLNCQQMGNKYKSKQLVLNPNCKLGFQDIRSFYFNYVPITDSFVVHWKINVACLSSTHFMDTPKNSTNKWQGPTYVYNYGTKEL